MRLASRVQVSVVRRSSKTRLLTECNGALAFPRVNSRFVNALENSRLFLNMLAAEHHIRRSYACLVRFINLADVSRKSTIARTDLKVPVDPLRRSRDDT